MTDTMTDDLTDTIDDVEVVRAYCDAWMSGDALAVLPHYHDDLALTWRGRHPLAGTYVGLDASISALLELQSLTGRRPVEILDVLGGEHGAVAIVRERWTRPAGCGVSPDSIEVLRALSFTVLDSRIRTCHLVSETR